MNIKKWHIAGIIFTLIVGTLNHFFYHWSGQSPLVAPFAAVNESTWEHLKLLVTPMLLFSVLEYFFYGRELDGFIAARVLSVFAGSGFIVAAFYGYTAITGKDWLWADICTFIAAVFIAYCLSFFLIKKKLFSSLHAEMAARILLAALIVCFILFTAYPPHIFLFQDPVTGQYGI